MKKTIIFTLLIFGVFSFCNAQDDNLISIFEDAEYYFYDEDYTEALINYMELLNSDMTNSFICYRIGICYLHSYFEKEKAIPFLTDAVKNVSKDVKEGFKETNAPIDSYIFLGDACFFMNKIDKAIEYYNKYKEIANKNDSYHLSIVDKKIETCNYAKEMKESPLRVQRKNLGKPVNTALSEINPLVSADENLLVYTSREKFYDGIFYSIKESGKWGAPKNFNFETGSVGNYFCTYLSPDGKLMLICEYEKDKNLGDIYQSTYENGKWTTIQKLNNHINSRYLETHACLSTDGNTIYIASNRKGGFGALDIYKSEKSSNGDWGPAKNLGATINSPFDEDSPFLLDNNILYFSSQGHYCVGGYDLFYSELDENNMWSEPVNLGLNVNTTGDERYYFPVKHKEYGYLYDAREDGFGENDIYLLRILPPEFEVKGVVRSSDSNIEITENLKIKIISEEDAGNIMEPELDPKSGEFVFKATEGKYNIIIEGEGFKKYTGDFILVYDNISEFVVDIKLTPDRVDDTGSGKEVVVKNVFFRFDNYKTDKYYDNLNVLANYFIVNTTAIVEIGGNTDAQGPDEYNIYLSQRRANFVKDYLIGKGVKEDNLIIKGYGETQLISIDQSPRTRKYNRRVEFKVLKQGNAILSIEPIDVPDNFKIK